MFMEAIEMLSPKGSALSTNNHRYTRPSDEEQRRGDLLIHLMDAFRAQEPKMPISYVLAFMAVARDPGKGPSDYARQLGTIQPVMSRILLEIGKKARIRGEGLGLVDYEADPGNLRTHRYFLTSKGKQFYRELMKQFESYDRAVLRG